LLAGAGALVLGTAATAIGVETGVLPGRSVAYHRLGLEGRDGKVPDVEPGPMVSGSFRSAHRLDKECGWTIAYPPGHQDGAQLPVAIVLHGQRNDHDSAFALGYLALGAFLAAATAAGSPPYALASVDGGDTYWHERASGEDSGAMVVEEFLPLLASRGLDTARIGFLGWSMGAFGALHLAQRLGATKVAAIGAMSPALWQKYDDTSPGSFDDEADFDDVTPFGHQAELDGIAIRIDCGDGDPFWAATRAYRDGFAEPPAGGFQRGDHDIGYWRRIVPQHLALLGTSLGRPAT
jgi:S-formylglutathione hydrolase FrmB